MKINSLELNDFRNHKDLEIEFDGETTLILGPNGAGKTNILEAIHLLATTKSLRAHYDRETIAHGKKMARLYAEISPNGGKKEIEMVIIANEKHENMSSKRVKVDKVKKSLSDFAGTFNSVLFTPHDIEIFTASPSVRRKYVDLLFFQIDREYKRTHREYVRAVRQRNKILEKIRDLGQGQDEISYWTEKILAKGSLLQAKRRNLFTFIREVIPHHAEKLNKEPVVYGIEYDANEINDARLKKYEKSEIASARTLIGPHRDDFFVEYNGFDVAKYGSRGQKRATLLAIKLCEIDFINKHLNRRPVLLLDDIFSELDEEHKEAVMNIVGLQQTIVTSAEDIELNGKMRRIPLS